jgi:hypothetical protein
MGGNFFLVIAAVLLVGSFAMMARSFSSLHRIRYRDRALRTLALSGSVFIAAATTVCVLVLSRNQPARDDDPSLPRAPTLAFDGVNDDEAAE